MLNKQYPVEGEKIFYIDNDVFNAILTSQYGYTLRKAKLIGGFCLSATKEIFIRESRRGDIKLLNHERGHLRGFKHVWFPTIMNPSWVGRIYNTYYPYKK